MRTSASKRLFSSAFQIRSYSAPADKSVPQSKQKYIPTGGSYPKGFLAGSSHAGVKASNTKYDDIALVVSEKPCAASAVFTRNLFKAAPVTVSKKFLDARQSDGFRAVVVNSGNANAVTGKVGLENAEAMSRKTDELLGHSPSQDARSLVMSTGVIGQRLPIDKIISAIPKAHAALGNTHDHWLRTAQAICTTDTFPKLVSRSFTLPSHPETTYSVAGFTKGAGMIHPNMATLLGIVCTDVAIEPASLHQILTTSVGTSFNSISIDGDTSTNDTVALLANGAATPSGVKPLSVSRPDKDLAAFQAILTELTQELAQLVVRDGEGATKFVTIKVQSDVDYMTAKRAAVSIATSAILKCALYGKDANWGRILCAIGYTAGIMDSPETPAIKTTQTPVIPNQTSVSFVPADGSHELKLLVRGEPEQVDEVRAKEVLEFEDLEILVKLNDTGDATKESGYEAVYWTCDFSHEYVTINGDYRT